MTKKRFSITVFKLLAMTVLLWTSCIDRFDNMEKYQRPSWLEGKIYTQIASNPEMSIFAEMLELTGYNEVLDKTGTYTAFVPSDSAFTIFLESKYRCL